MRSSAMRHRGSVLRLACVSGVPKPAPSLLSRPAASRLGMILDTVKGTVCFSNPGHLVLPLITSTYIGPLVNPYHRVAV